MTLAHKLCTFPQGCMRSDRRAAFYSTYDATSAHDALKYEYESGMEHLQEAVLGKVEVEYNLIYRLIENLVHLTSQPGSHLRTHPTWE